MQIRRVVWWMERLASSKRLGVANQDLALVDCNETTVTINQDPHCPKNPALYVVGIVGDALCAGVRRN